MLHVCNLDVAKVDLDVSVLWMLIPDVATLFSIFFMLQTLILDVADTESRCCRHVLLGVANIFFQCCRCCISMLQTCGVGCCVEERGEEAPDVGCCTQHGSQHGRNIVATWSQHGGRKERLLMLDVVSNCVRNIFATHSQHARNIYSVDFRSNG
jgi:hypothetical protein